MTFTVSIIAAAVRRTGIPALRRFCLLIALSALGFLMTGCQTSARYTDVYKPFDGVENYTKNFEQVKIICEGEAQSVLFKQPLYIPPPPCYLGPCIGRSGTVVSGGPKKHFSGEKYASCVARHGWQFSHRKCIAHCENADGNTQFLIGISHYKGEDVPQSDEEAANWFKRAARKGSAEGQFALGLFYAEGSGVPQNMREAYIWLSIAELNGIDQASEPRKKAAESFSGAELFAIKSEIRKRRDAIRNRQSY